MKQYIDKSALVAEIRKRLLPTIRDKHYDEWEEGQDSERIAILEIIDTLEVKEVNLDGEIDKWICDAAITHEDCSVTDVISTAKYFFELGLKAKNNKENEWKKDNIKPPFVDTMGGNKYSEPVLCRDKFGGYFIAKYVRWQTGYCGWFDDEKEISITHWKELT